MDATGCISNQTWQDYAAGRMDERSKALLLAHAASCAVCADILEGISLMKEPALLEQQVKRINDAVDLRTVITKTRNINTLWYVAAAILVMACGISWYIYTPQEEQPIALRQQPEQAVEQPIQERQEIVHSKEQVLEPGKHRENSQTETAREEIKVLVPEKPLPAEQVVITRKRALTDTQYDKTAIEAEPAGLADASVTETKTNEDAAKQAADQETEIIATGSRNVSQQKAIAKKSKETYPSAYSANNNAGLNNYNLRGARMDTDSLTYQRALQQYQRSQYDSSAATLSVIVSDPSSAFHEEAMLLAAKLHIAKGDKAAAKKTLKALVDLKGKTLKESEQLLNSLK